MHAQVPRLLGLAGRAEPAPHERAVNEPAGSGGDCQRRERAGRPKAQPGQHVEPRVRAAGRQNKRQCEAEERGDEQEGALGEHRELPPEPRRVRVRGLDVRLRGGAQRRLGHRRGQIERGPGEEADVCAREREIADHGGFGAAALLRRAALASQELVAADAENLGNDGDCRQIRRALVALPAADGLVGYVEALGQLALGHAIGAAQRGDEAADSFPFHG